MEYFTSLHVLILGLVVVVLAVSAVSKVAPRASSYRYGRKESVMTSAEREYFRMLEAVCGNRYVIFPQMHLSSVLDPAAFRQNWKGARAHIDRKSVDFVICDRDTLSVKCVIELDDRSHERSDRRSRDAIVEEICKDAGLPLVRIKNHGAPDRPVIEAALRAYLA